MERHERQGDAQNAERVSGRAAVHAAREPAARGHPRRDPRLCPLRPLPPELPDLPRHRARDLVAARAHLPHARPRGGHGSTIRRCSRRRRFSASAVGPARRPVLRAFATARSSRRRGRSCDWSSRRDGSRAGSSASCCARSCRGARRLGLLVGLLALVQRIGLDRLAQRVLPKRLAASAALLPRIPAAAERRRMPAFTPARGRAPRPRRALRGLRHAGVLRARERRRAARARARRATTSSCPRRRAAAARCTRMRGISSGRRCSPARTSRSSAASSRSSMR